MMAGTPEGPPPNPSDFTSPSALPYHQLSNYDDAWLYGSHSIQDAEFHYGHVNAVPTSGVCSTQHIPHATPDAWSNTSLPEPYLSLNEQARAWSLPTLNSTPDSSNHTNQTPNSDTSVTFQNPIIDSTPASELRKRKRSMTNEQRKEQRLFPCPIFEDESKRNVPHTCNGRGGKNMSELRRHMTRKSKSRKAHLDFLRRCETCNDDIIDEITYGAYHGPRCNNPHILRKGDAALEQYQALCELLKGCNRIEVHVPQRAIEAHGEICDGISSARIHSNRATQESMDQTLAYSQASNIQPPQPQNHRLAQLASDNSSASTSNSTRLPHMESHSLAPLKQSAPNHAYFLTDVYTPIHHNNWQVAPDVEPFSSTASSLAPISASTSDNPMNPWSNVHTSPYAGAAFQPTIPQIDSVTGFPPIFSAQWIEPDRPPEGDPRPEYNHNGNTSSSQPLVHVAVNQDEPWTYQSIRVPSPLSEDIVSASSTYRSGHARSQSLSAYRTRFESPHPATAISLPSESHCGETLGCSVEGCTNTFAGLYRRASQLRHIRLKHGVEERKYTCEVEGCGKSYHRQDARLKHYRHCHPDLHVRPPLRRK